MKTIIAGSRNIDNYDLLLHVLDLARKDGIVPTKIISGGAKGVDALAIWYADSNEYPLSIMNAKWHAYGKSAGIIRNEEMAKEADALIAIWDGKSPGTKNMIETARKYNLRIYVYTV